MARYCLLIEYDGGSYHGWQRQGERPTIQHALETALHAIDGKAVEVVGAGRTDAGVHARGQVAHLDLDKDLAVERLAAAVNAHLRPQPISVLRARVTVPEFHARFDARQRLYRYTILNRRAPPAIEREHVWHVPARLDAERMHEAASRWLGRHDFSSFRASDCQAPSPVKTLDRLYVRREQDRIEIHAAARSFLHHQVRNMVGTLKAIGEGKYPIEHAASVLHARDRSAAGMTAPARGLCLCSVRYATDTTRVLP